jgi:hypothetical protein
MIYPDQIASYSYGYHQGVEDRDRTTDSSYVPPEVMQAGNNNLKVEYILKHAVVRTSVSFPIFIFRSITK